MELKKLHPYFQLSLLEELYKAKIYEIDENKKKIEQDLIITNVGFFFLRRRGFSSGFTLSNAISPESILAVTIEDDKMVFTIEQENDSSNQQKKTFTSNENTKIIAIMKQVRCALFGDITINTNTDSLKDELQLNTMQYSSKNQNAERFLAHAINSNHSDLLSMAQSIFEMFSKENNSFTITHEIIKSSLINPFIQTLLSLRYFYEIIIFNNQYSVFLDFISQILKQSKFLKKITFDNISFAKLNSNDTIFQGKDIEKSFDSIAFVNGCDFTSNQFLIFLRDFSSYTGNIESIVIKNCKFTSNTLPSFFDHINGVKSIKKVKYFEIDGLSSNNQIQEPLIRLLNNSNQFFHCIKVTNLPLDAEVVLSGSTLFDNHVEEFHLHDSNFLKAIIPIENYYSCNTIDLSRTKFKLESLVSFFNNIKPPIRKIILNEINIDNKSLSEFYQQLPKYNFQFIEQFEFANNPIPSSYNQIFLDFISKMKNLAVLNISSSLDSSDSSVIENASNLLHSLKNLLLLIFKGSGKSSFKSEFTSIFDKLPPYLFYLDISGQNIGDDGMIKLAEFIVSRGKPNSQLQDIFEFKATQINHFLSNFEAKADGTLQYIIFNRMGCTIKGFLSVLESIVGRNSAIKNAEWGQQEIYRLSKKDSSFEKNQLESRIQQLKNLFDDKFANNSKDPILSTSSFSTNSIIHFSLSSSPNQELNKKEKRKKREKDKEKKDDKERSKRKKRSKEKIEENENNDALAIEKERKERKRKEKKDSKDKVEVKDKDKTEEKEKREKKRKEKRESKDKNEVNEKVEETENGETKRKEKKKPKEKTNAEIIDKTEPKANEKRKSDEKKIKKKKDKEDRKEEKETKKDIKYEKEKETKKDIKFVAEKETKEKVEKEIKNELEKEVTNEIKEENENINKNEVEEEKDDEIKNEKYDEIKNEDENENEKDDEVEIKSEAENEKDDEVEIKNEDEAEKDNEGEIKNEVDKRIENEEAVDNDAKYDGIKIEEEEDLESGNDEIEIEEEEEEKEKESEDEDENENANEYEKEEQSGNEYEKESSDEEQDDRESLENKKEEEESSNKEKENDGKEEQETKNESEKEEFKKDDEFESIPPIVIKPKVDYRAIILDNSNQPFYDDLVECVGADSVSKCPLEDALNRLQKEAPFLLS